MWLYIQVGSKMIDVFISRPTWIAEEFREGLTGFLSFLDTHDIKPRTLGATDYPTESPLDEVITIIEQCKGVIILGYPQIYVTEGKIKEKETGDFILPTEWNHIEAALAYMKKMPLLIIHHKGISRGVFEHGAISKYIYQKDLSKPNWFLSEDMTGALKKWKSSIKEPQIITKPAPKPVPMPTSSERRLENNVESVLVFLFNQNRDKDRCTFDIKNKFNCTEQAAQYYIDVLLKRKMIAFRGEHSYGDYYSLTPIGREYVMTNKLVSF
jgi:hypothetical protein